MSNVGVIITTYGKNRLWEKAVISVIKQNIDDIALILSDDGTPDFDVDEAYRKIRSIGGHNLGEVIVRKNNENLGTVKNINLAAKELKTEYILLLAGDDELYSEDVINEYVNIMKIKNQYQAIVGQSVDFSYDMKLMVGKQDEDAIYNKKFSLLDKSGKELFTVLASNCFIPSSGMMYRRDFLEEVNWFDERYKLVEDWPMFLKMARNKYKIYYAKFISVKHRAGGVSSVNLFALKQNTYQTDLINIIDREILANINFIIDNAKENILQLCNDKKKIYFLRYRFKNLSFVKKIIWIIKNLFFVPVIVRKILGRENIG